ncbi:MULTISPECIES: Zn-ribbon domain-containing OB-fold protein [Neobacillus]|uniref:Zn-ribbon domain-containing OB-fold protein n=1 Tax=Neobacillus rhizophilus TaxID=2833579 RepID=A0A942YVB8_9BACI|nr:MULTISPECIES: Zn-ribbon domain-containing OB-fold protein [Neobacillus]MBS4214903.1 Zn-ribbon domain-containing OB-fold protein [Neobacillus rhizophilus]MBU8918864.1 Zn-ribbon domain-containing OB-fold protein [Bacillus sp. FJAT-29953]
MIEKPLPIPDGDSDVFWQGCKEHKLLIQKCEDCSSYIFYPRVLCPNCFSEKVEWVQSSGVGKVYSFTIARRPGGPAFKDEVPYVVALIELEEGVRMLSNIIDVDVDKVDCDMPVEVVFQVEGDFTLPKFKPRAI